MEKTIHVGLARKERHTAKTTDVAKVELLVRLVQVRHYMSMGRQRLPGLNNHKLARHPQVEDQMKTFFQPKHDPFSSPDNRFDLFASQGGSPACIPGPAQVLLPDPKRGDPATDQTRAQVRDDGFHFRQLRHGISLFPR